MHLQEKVASVAHAADDTGKRIMHSVAKFQRYKLAKDAVRAGMRQKDAAQLYAVNASRLSRVMRLPGRLSRSGGTRKAPPVERTGENENGHSRFILSPPTIMPSLPLTCSDTASNMSACLPFGGGLGRS